VKKTKVYNQVVELLEENRPSRMTGVTPRDSDKELLIQFMQIHLGMQLTAVQMDLLRTVNFESIRRTRAKLQEQGQYLGSPEVMKKRRIKGLVVADHTPKETADILQRRISENA